MRNEFLTLSYADPRFSGLFESAEQNVFTDPTTTLIKLRIVSEFVTDKLAEHYGVHFDHENHAERLDILFQKALIPPKFSKDLHRLRRLGNKAAHNNVGTSDDARACIEITSGLVTWFNHYFLPTGHPAVVTTRSVVESRPEPKKKKRKKKNRTAKDYSQVSLVSASSQRKEDPSMIPGAAIGGVIGGCVGGPVGAVFGAAAGGVFSKIFRP